MPKFRVLPFCLTLLLRTLPAVAVQVTSIRLMNGASPSVRIGRVEIQVDNINTWGSICDDGWDDKEAIVACRMLGFTNGGTAVTDARYGVGTLNFLMDDSACTGDESSLSECLSSQISDCNRNTDSDAGVVCNENLGPGQPTPTRTPTTTAPTSIISGNCQQTNPTVRLYGRQGIDGVGYVEVQQPTGAWGFVCDDGWSSAAAKIVCAQLCYPTNYTAKPGIPAEYMQKPTNPTVILDNVNCFGNETTLQNCQHASWGAEDCLTTDGELAGVQCVAAPYLPPTAPVPNLICGEGKMIAQFSRVQDANLEAKHLSVFNQPNCADATKSTTNATVSITIPVDKCGTTISRNGTHIIYYNEVKYDFTSQEGAITRVNTYRVQITCVLPVDVEITQRVQPLTQAVTQSSVGKFQVSLLIYRSDSFTVPVTENPVQIPLGEYLNMAVTMEEYDPNLKLVVTDCLASPTGDLLATVRKVLFADKCSQEDSLSFYPLSNFRFGFRFKPFKFVGYDILYIHCNAIICLASDNTQECDRTCANTKPNVTATPNTGRRRRSANIYRVSASSQAIIIYDPHAPGPNFGGGDDTNNNAVGAKYSTINEIATTRHQEVMTPRPHEQEKASTSTLQLQESAKTLKSQNQVEVSTSKPQQQDEASTVKPQQQEKATTSIPNQQQNSFPDIHNSSVGALNGKVTDSDGSCRISLHLLLLIIVLLTIVYSVL